MEEAISSTLITHILASRPLSPQLATLRRWKPWRVCLVTCALRILSRQGPFQISTKKGGAYLERLTRGVECVGPAHEQGVVVLLEEDLDEIVTFVL